MLVILANCYYLLFNVMCLVQISPSGPIRNKNKKKQDEAATTLKGVQGGKILHVQYFPIQWVHQNNLNSLSAEQIL